ncbi:unnamed protein product [Blepharisma stoltei]|uniref:Phosphatidylinositol-specific phospholipase C X domain-containing protein n=1 Tax=Blepharisma stoltei TaxID=1481888 RepID=A0AAU9ICK4_9CILI|nr:unnamed protein product [Blepharisma stoltei]
MDSVEISKDNERPSKSYWMEQNLCYIACKKLREIFIPGSHNSGAYRSSNKIVSPWVKCQSKSFLKQLNAGVRYFDCRLEYRTDKGQDHLWFHHGKYDCDVSILALLDAVTQFLSRSPKEIIILDFSHFRKFKKTAFDELNQYFTILSDVLILKDEAELTVIELLELDKRVMILTDKHEFGNHLFGESINKCHSWPDTSEIKQLKKFLKKKIAPKQELWLCQCVLTPKLSTCKMLAKKLKPYLEKWFDSVWMDYVNIVFTDFSHDNNIVDIAIRANQRRGMLN